MLVFLAPETGGDFKTLMGAVRGRPGAFVRTSQDLNQAALDRSRLEHYLSAIRALNDAEPAKLQSRRRCSRAASRSRSTRSVWTGFPSCRRLA